jgi:ABC-type multidrug transport system permease subunit
MRLERPAIVAGAIFIAIVVAMLVIYFGVPLPPAPE